MLTMAPGFAASPLPAPANAQEERAQQKQPARRRRKRIRVRKSANPPRPMNCFMLWSRTRRSELALEYPELPNNEISRLLGAEWKTLPDDVKQHFFEQASQEKADHAERFPGYRYTPSIKPKSASPSICSDDQASRTASQLLDDSLSGAGARARRAALRRTTSLPSTPVSSLDATSVSSAGITAAASIAGLPQPDDLPPLPVNLANHLAPLLSLPELVRQIELHRQRALAALVLQSSTPSLGALDWVSALAPPAPPAPQPPPVDLLDIMPELELVPWDVPEQIGTTRAAQPADHQAGLLSEPFI